MRDPGGDLPAWDPDHPPAKLGYQRTALRRVVLPGYFRALRIPLRLGRDFNSRDREKAPFTLVINEQMARTLFSDTNPLGRRVSVGPGRPAPDHVRGGGRGGETHASALSATTPGPPCTCRITSFRTRLCAWPSAQIRIPSASCKTSAAWCVRATARVPVERLA